MDGTSQDLPSPPAASLPPQRRTILRGAAVVSGLALGGGVLAGCGSDDGRSASSDSGNAPSSEPSRGASGTELGPASDVEVGGGAIYADQKVVVTQPTKGDFKAFSAICTHQGCTVTQVSSDGITCPCHGSTFSIEDGSPTHGPATEPLPAEAVTDSAGTLRLG